MTSSITQRLDAVAALIASLPFSSHAEAELQRTIAASLDAADLPHIREHRFTARDRVDFFLVETGLAIECKVTGGTAPLARQLARYAEHDEVHGLLLVTTKMQHRAVLPDQFADKPLRVVVLHRLP